MAKGVGKKPDTLKTGENPRPGTVASDDLSSVDLGQDFVKSGETARKNREV